MQTIVAAVQHEELSRCGSTSYPSSAVKTARLPGGFCEAYGRALDAWIGLLWQGTPATQEEGL